MAEFLGVVIAAALFLGWIAGTLVLFAYEKWVTAFAWLVIGMSFFVWHGSKGAPCARYENRVQYDPALKMARTMRVCVERGEWVDG